MRSLFPFRPRHQDFEWIGGRYTLPNKVRDGGAVIQPEVVLWLELPRGVLVGVRMIDPREPVSFAETLSEAMKHPAEGLARRPARIRVSKKQLAEQLRETIGSDISVVVAPVPELDDAFADLTSSIAATEPQATYLADGAIAPATVARLFAAASIVFRMAPWRRVSEHQILRIDIPKLQVEGACLSVIGGAGESFGLLLFRSVDAYAAFASGPPAPASEEELLASRARRETQLLSLSFDRKKDLPSSMLREIERHRWEVAGAKGYPTVMAVDAKALPQQPTEREYRILTACATAFVAFFAGHRDLFVGDEKETVCESFTGDDDLTVTITAPFGSDAIASVEDFYGFDEDALVESVPVRQAVGRNDPCPCGSGKKYKKCHLNTSLPSSAGPSSKSETVHDMDFRLVRAIGQFANRRFGRAWLEPLGGDLDLDEASLQLVLPWAAWTAAVDGTRVADSFLEQKGQLSGEERGWFDAQRRAWLSVWEVTRVEPGTIDARDLLTGEKRSIREVAGSRLLVARDSVLARVIDFRGTSLFGGLYGRVLRPTDALEVIRAVRSKLRAGKGDGVIERLRDPLIGRFMIDRWRDAVDDFDRRAAIPPKLENTDGDPLLFVTESFRFEAGTRDQIEKRLTAMDDVDNVQTNETETELVYVKRGNRMHRSWENTVVGRVIVTPDLLQIETNSERRADALGRRVRDACAGLLRDATRKTEHPSSIQAAAKRVGTKSKEPAGMSPQEQALLREAKEAHYRDWLDTPIPLLGGKTPRSAARSAKSREKLDLLLRDMENSENRLPAAARYDVARLRQELGLDAAR